MITDSTWDILFKLFLDDRVQSIFDIIQKYAIDHAAEMVAKHSMQAQVSEMTKVLVKPRLKDFIQAGKVHVGERIFTKKRPEQTATIVDGDTVEYQGEILPINTWGQRMTGWSSISIYNSVFLVRTGQPLKNLREQERHEEQEIQGESEIGNNQASSSERAV